jgi:hypothetical protein
VGRFFSFWYKQVTVHKSREEEEEKEGEGELRHIPVGLEELEASGAFVDGVCTQAAAVGEEDGCSDVGVVQWRRGDAGDASRRWQCTLGIGLGLGQWSGGSEVNLVTLTIGPHLLFIALRDGGHQPRHWAGRPRSGREVRWRSN